ncbi:MAG: DNA cytosine methyltransferase [Beijerinckiaceae bacterium]|nr:DNA cytosine methyltransferase [Beijerinckiaceae bacterium]
MGGGNRSGPVDVAATLTAKGQRIDFEVETFIADVAGTLPAGANSTGGHRQPGMGQETADTMLIAHTLRGEGFDASEDGTGRGTPIVPVYAIQERAVSENPNAGPDGMGVGKDVAYTLEARTQVQAIAFDTTQITSKANRSNPKAGDPCHPLAAAAHPPALAYRTSGNCGAWETGDRVDALTTGTDPNSHIIAFSCKDHGADAADDLAPTLRAMGHSASHANAGGQVAVAYGITADALDRQGEGAGGTSGERSGLGITAEMSPTLRAKRPNAVAYDLRGREGGAQFEGPHETANIRAADGGSSRSYVAETWAVRRLTEDECARLQGFPDGHSRIPWRGRPAEECPAGPQYKTYGNSMAVNVMRWLGERLTANMPEAA